MVDAKGAAVLTDSQQTVPDEKNSLTQAIFPDGFEVVYLFGYCYL